MLPPLSSHAAVREALRFTRARPSVAAGLRAGLLTTLPLLLAPLLGRSGVAFMGLAGFGTTLVDKGGSYRTRFLAMAAYGVLGSAGVLLGTELAPHPWLAVPLLFASLWLCGYVRVLGAEAAAVGVFVGVDLIICLSRPLPDHFASVEAAGFFALGNLWGQVLALGVWPLRPYKPARAALGRALEALAQVADALNDVVPTAEAQRARRVKLGATRTALEAARAALDSSRRGRSGPTRRGARLVLAVEDTDLLFGALIALEDELTRAPTPALSRATRLYAARARDGLRAYADAVVREQPVGAAEPGQRNAAGDVAEAPPLLQRAWAELAQLHDDLLVLDSADAAAPQARTARLYGEERPPVRSLLRDHLTLRSAFMRHAMRASLGAVLAHGLSAALQLSHGYWATLTCFVIMQPQGTATTAKALQRVGGTLLGAGLAVLVASTISNVWALALCVLGFVAVGVALLPLNYGAYAVFLTPGFVLLAEHAAGDAGLASVRVLNTCIGAAIALVCSRAVLPFAERDQFRPLMASALDAIAELVVTASAPVDLRLDVHRARRRAGLALLNAEASHQRLLTESRLGAGEGEALLTMLLYAHRVTALLTVLGESGSAARAALHEAAPSIVQELRSLGENVRGRTPELAPAEPRAQPERVLRELPDGLSHLRAQLGVLANAVQRFTHPSGKLGGG